MGTRQLGMFYKADGTENVISMPYAGTKIEHGTLVSLTSDGTPIVADGTLPLFGVVAWQKIYVDRYISIATGGYINARGTADMVIGQSPLVVDPAEPFTQKGIVMEKLELIDEKTAIPLGARILL